MNIHSSWSDMELGSFTKTHGYCPLCATYHDLHADNGLIYCVFNDIQLTGWDINLYNKLATEPSSVDINQYASVKDRLIRAKLVKTLPLIIERRVDLLRKVASEKAKPQQQQQPIVVVQENQFPTNKRYWNRVGDCLGLN